MADPSDPLVGRIRRTGVRETARRAKVSATTVSQWITGQMALPRTTVDRIIRATKE